MYLYPGSSCAWGLLLGEELWTTKQNSSHRVHQPLQSWSPVLLAAVSMAAALQEKTSNRVSPMVSPGTKSALLLPLYGLSCPTNAIQPLFSSSPLERQLVHEPNRGIPVALTGEPNPTRNARNIRVYQELLLSQLFAFIPHK